MNENKKEAKAKSVKAAVVIPFTFKGKVYNPKYAKQSVFEGTKEEVASLSKYLKIK